MSGQGKIGSLVGTSDAPGKVGRARQFSGAERIIAPAIPVYGLNFTVAAWFNWTKNPSPYYSGIHGGGGSWELRVMADGRFGGIVYQSIAPDIFTETWSSLAYNDGTWHHSAAVFRNGLVELYVDGVLVAQDTTNPIASARVATSTEIGRIASDFVGGIDEIRVYSRALTSSEITALATGSIYTVPGLEVGPLTSISSVGPGTLHQSIGRWFQFRIPFDAYLPDIPFQTDAIRCGDWRSRTAAGYPSELGHMNEDVNLSISRQKVAATKQEKLDFP